ncbi:MAG TPA: alpha-amylase family protein [Limnochordia bacterium]
MAQWWLQPHRMIQTNLREIDADLDPDKLIADLLDFGADVLLFNTGGIVASYPTVLPFHFRNPYLKNDLVGEVLTRCHKHGIRFIARMDFSKANRCFYSEHPDWFYRTAAGTVVDYNGQLHTCVNGPYQREHALAIIEEVLDRYPIDGMFFNMFGYQTSDYSGNYHGLCHCENCRRRFRAEYGHEIPRREDPHDPIYRLHQRFRAQAAREMREAIVRLIRSQRADVAIAGADFLRKESNTALARPLPHWIYEASEHVKSVMDAWPKRAVANAAVHFLDIPYRHVSVPPHLTALRIAQNMAGSGWLDFYCIGPLDRQEDRAAFPLIKELYHFHRAHAQEYYSGLEPAARAALWVTRGLEYRGLYRILVESHRPFDVITPDSLPHAPADLLRRYDVILVADPAELSQADAAALDRYVEEGGRLLTTGRLPAAGGVRNGEGPCSWCSLGIDSVRELRTDARASYFKISEPDRFPRLGGAIDITFNDEYYQHCDLREGAERHLRWVPPCMYGPPEKCYYEEVTDEPGLVLYRFGRGATACFPWPLATLYYKYSSPVHLDLVADTLTHLLHVPDQLRTDASAMVEFTLYRQPERGDRLLLHLVNSSGHHGTAFHPPVPMRDIQIALRRDGPVSRVRALWAGEDLPFRMDDGMCCFTLPRLGLVEAVAIA